MKLEGKAKLLRIHFGEDDKWQGKPLYEAIVIKCRELDIAGASVFRGIEGYGASSRIHKAHLLRSSDRPIMVSVIDTEQNIGKLLPALDEMVDEGLIAMSEVEVIRYVHQEGVRSPAS
jgi:PII-like signaling protein